MTKNKNRVCPPERAGFLDNKFRRWLQNPHKILSPYIGKAMTVLDLGCGPGFFTIDIAQMVGEAGRVIAVDMQQAMLQKVRDKINGTDLGRRITLHKCDENSIGLSEKVDFALAFYMVHEVSNQQEYFNQVKSLLKPGAQLLIVEPLFHVSRRAFEEMIKKAGELGFEPDKGPKVFFSRTILLKKPVYTKKAV